jgi:hypothetical protein
VKFKKKRIVHYTVQCIAPTHIRKVNSTTVQYVLYVSSAEQHHLYTALVLNLLSYYTQITHTSTVHFISSLLCKFKLLAEAEAGISVNLGHPQGRALKSTLNFLGRIPCLSLIGIDL